MAYRFRAHIFWDSDPASMYHSPGHAQWAGQQVEQRLTMAFHLNEGARNEERSEFGSPDGYEWTCNVFVPDESKAILDDFFNHILAESVRMTTKVIEGEGEVEYLPSWMDIHHCFNGENLPCEQPYMTFSTDIPEPQEPPIEPPANPCEGVAAWTNTQHWSTYVAGDLRTDGGKLWECHSPQWAQSYAPSSAYGHLAWTFVADCVI